MYKNILVINLAFIGDIVLAVPAVRALHETFPDARITMLTVPLTESIARMNPYLDDVLIYDKKGRDKGILRRVVQPSHGLRGFQADLVTMHSMEASS